MSNKREQDSEPTAQLFFVERNTGSKTLNILHQVYRRADGTVFLREVSKLSLDEAERRYGLRKNDYSMYGSGALKA